MKQKIFFLILLLIGLATISYAQISENFETWVPTGWTNTGFTQSATQAHGGTYSARGVNGTSAGTVYLTTPLLAEPGTLTFWVRRGGSSDSPNTFHYDYATQAAPTTWTEIGGTGTAATTSWVQQTLNLTSYSNIFLRFRWNHTSSFYMDDVSITVDAVPTITLTGSLSNYGLVAIGNYSDQSYSVSATTLAANLVITAPTGYQISTTSGVFSTNTLTLTHVAGTIGATTIYVRFIPGTAGVLSGNITHVSSGATQKDQPVSGTGITTPEISVPSAGSITSTTANLGGNITNINFSDVTERGIYYSTIDGFVIPGTATKVSETAGPYGTGAFTMGVTGLTAGTIYYYKAFATNAAGTTYTTQGIFSTPIVSVTAALVDFGSVKLGSSSTEQNYTVSGSFLTASVIITAPAGFQISDTSGAGFGASVTLPPAPGGALASTTIYIRFTPTGVGVASGDISHASTGATTQELGVSGTGINNPAIGNPTFTSITSTTAVLGGNVTSINSSDVTERGIYYSTTNPIADGAGTKVSSFGTFGTGPFTENVSGLTKGTTYYFKAFATNGAGTTYTLQSTFSTPGITITGSLANFGLVKVGINSTEKTYTVAGANLTANLVITAPTGYQVSKTTGAGFGSSISYIPNALGTVATSTVYVRFNPATTGVIGGMITNTSTFTTTEEVAVSGTGIDNPVVENPTSASLTSTSAVLGGEVTNINFSPVNERGVYYSTIDGFVIPGTATKVSETAGPYGTGLFTLPVIGLSQGITYYYKAFATNAAGTSYTTQASFLTPAVFTPASIVVTQANPASGTVVIGSIITVTVTDNLNGTVSAFQTVTANLSEFGGPVALPMIKTSNAPLNGVYTVVYTVLPGNIDASGRTVSVTVSNYTTVEDETEFVVKNYLDVPDILTAYLQVNNDPTLTKMKIGDTIHLKLTLKSYVDSVWVNWGSAFTGGPTLGYKASIVAGIGYIDATYPPVAGQLVFTPNLTILVPRMKSNNGYYTYSARLMTPFSKSVSLTAAPLSLPITADLTVPDISNLVDLYYDPFKPLRFSPIIAGIDGYTTLNNTFAIRFLVPGWGTPGEANTIELKFEAESRSTFYRTYTIPEVTNETSPDRNLPFYQQIIWDGKDNLGNYVSSGVSTTYGITIWALKDAVGNNADISHELGPEYSPAGVEDDATHNVINDGITILNRIHVAVDNLNPIYNQNLTIADPNDLHLIRYINENLPYNGAYDSGETVSYTDISSPTSYNGNNVVGMSFKVQREYTVDSNPLRHETVKGWVVLEQVGVGTKWYYNGASWIVINPADLTFQYTDVAQVTFPTAATYSNVVNVNWDSSNLVTFPGSDPGITYKLYGYIQDNAGNIVKSVEKSVIIENRYVQLPIITAINLTSQHIPGTGGILPAVTGGVNNYYLTAAYVAGDLPYSGNYYASRDTIKVEFTVNNEALLRATQSVLVDFPAGFGIADFYILKSEFDAVTHKVTKSFNVANIVSSAGSTGGTIWTISENPVGAGSIQVKTWSSTIISGNNIEGEVNDSEPFRLIIPAKPVFPTTNVNDYLLTATPPILSPGNPLFTYDANTNPANDNNIDETNFSFTIPPRSTAVHWELRLETQDAIPSVFRTWSGDLAASATPDNFSGPTYNFNGITDLFTLGVPIEATQLLNLKLIIQPEGYADPGYVAPPSNITPTTVVKVDNTNPVFTNGAASTFNAANGVISLIPAGTPIVTETEDLLAFTVYTSEKLSASIGSGTTPIPGADWQVEVRDSLGAILMNGTPVTATITGIIPGNGNATDGYQTFALTVRINNLAGDYTVLKPVLIVKSPWDTAGNPARYNNPVYPYNADVFHNDSNEGYLTFNILNAKPKITQIDFTHKTVVGTAKYSGSAWNPQFTQGWVNQLSPTTFTMTATVTGGVYPLRDLGSYARANLSALMGPTFTSVAPDVTNAPAGAPNEARVWTLTWTNKAISAALAAAWIDNQVLNIPINIDTHDTAIPTVHIDTRDINIKVDKVNPTISSSTVSLLADGSPQSFVFSIADPTPGSGINWTTATLSLAPNTGSLSPGTMSPNGTWPVTIPANSPIKYIDATCSVSDYMGNSYTYHRYVNVIPVPAISAVTLTTVNSGEVSNAYFVPGRNLTVGFAVANPQRVKRLVVTLTTTGGVTILSNVQTITSGIVNPMSVVFNGVTSTIPTNLDGKVITATITGVTDAYTAPTASAIQEINLTNNNSTATINVDTKPVITSTKFYYNNVETNTLLKNMTNVKIVAVVSNVNALNNTTNPMTITMQNVTGSFNLTTPVVTTGTGTTTYTWNNVSFTNLTWSPASDYKVAAFKFNCRTIYGYAAAERSHEMGVLSDRSSQIYGVVNARTPYAGIDPDGWFAPEHLLKVDYTFISALDQTLPPIRANFDQIEDNLQDNWTNPSALSTKTPIVISLIQGGTPVSVTVYKYLAKWSVQPDVQSVWNAYDDGAAAPVYFKYRQYPTTIVPDEIDDNRSIQVDKKVPVYDTAQLWVAVKATTPISTDYQFINNGFNRPTSLALQSNGSWVTGNNVYVKYRAKDSTTGIGVTEVYTPANPTGWTATNVSQTDLGLGVIEKVVQLTPANPAAISASTTLAVTLAKVEDKVGHVNYGLPINSTDTNWVLSGPILNFTFNDNYATNLLNLEAFQVIGGNYTDNKTKPYVRAGQPLGVILKLAPHSRGVDVLSIVVSNVKINTKWITSVGGTAADNFVTLAYNAPGDYYYLNTSTLVNSLYTQGSGITLQYQINYTITYTDLSTSTQQFTSPSIPNMAYVENNSPVLKDVWVWSGSLGSAQEGYVVPLDSDGTVKVIFEEQAGFVNPTTKPSVSITNLNVFVTGVSSPYTVPAAALTYYDNYSLTIRGVVKNYTNVWVADLVNLQIKVPSPVVTSTEIGYTIADVVGNPPISGDRFVEIAANGPLVPIIRFTELVTTLPDAQVVNNYLAQKQPTSPNQPTVQLKIYSDVAEAAYIDSSWATPIPGFTFGAFSQASVAPTTLHNSRYVITIPVTPDNINNISPIDSIMITVNTRRNPFGGDVFYDAETIGVRVDGEMFNLINPAVISNSVYGNIPGMINPAVQTTVTATVNDIGELIGLRGLANLPSNATLAGWFTLQNNTPATFTTIPTPVVTGTGNGRTVTWTIPSADIDQTISTATGTMSVKIEYRDIYGLVKTYDNISFNVDKVNPIISANGIKFYDTHTATPTMLQQNNYTNPGWITNSLDWDKVRFVFEDPIIRTDVNGAGVNSATVTMTKEDETYPTPALGNLNFVVVDANTIELQFANGFSANELAEGYYNFNITAVDNIENDVAYTQRFWYGFAPATLLIQPGNNSTLVVSDLQQQVSAITGDTQGQINGIDFHLYYDANDDGIYQAGTDPDYTADITADDGNPDMVVPYDVMWNLTNRSHYAYLNDPEYGIDATRRFLLRASIISQNRSVTDSIVVINVTDDVPAVPEIPWYSGNTTFDYLNSANNVLTFTTRFINWPDAKRVRFEITKVGDPTLIDTLGAELAYPTDYPSVQWNFSNKNPGEYLVKVYGRDVVGNWSSAVAMTAPITIYDPASIVTYGMTMWNVQGYDINEQIIPDGDIYGFNHQASTIGNLRLDVRFDSLYVHSNGSYNYLSGVDAITFKAVVRNNITGTETIVDVPNNTALQPDYPALGSIPVTPQIMNIPVRIFVPDSFFMPVGYDSNDFTYKFFIELTPTHPAVLQPPVYSNIRFDYFAPRVVITSNTPYITWSKNNQFVLQDSVLVGTINELRNDISDIDEITLMWSLNNGVTWHDAVATQVNNPYYIRFDNWVTKGGAVNTLLYNYEGNVSLKVRAYDALGNMRESSAISAYVDNKAPVVPISQVAYSTVDQNQIVQNPYTVLHSIGTLPNEAGNTITAVTSSGTYGTSVLQLRTNQIEISDLSTTAIGPTYTSWYTYPDAPWYPGNNDLRPPIILYHGYSATGDSTEILWTPGELYDHEADVNGNYGFDINFKAWAQMYNMPLAGTHYFIFAAKDSRGNMEGDYADTLGTYYDGMLSNLEKMYVIDLTVNVINVSDVTGEITQVNQYHDNQIDNKIVSEWVNLTADITGNAYNVDVDQVRFERKVGDNWLPISTISRADEGEARPLMFHLYRSDIPQFDGLPYVPGVHLYADGYFVRELTWNQTDGAWADTVSFTQGHHNFEYRLDLNNDGVIDGLDSNIANVLGVSFVVSDPNGFTNFNVTPWITYLDTRSIPIGLYEFRALPLTAQGDVLFNKVAPSRWLVLDNTAPVTSMTVVGGTTRIQPNVNFGMVADVNELLVALDDLVDVTYQYASQPQLTVWLNNSSFRRWNNIASSTNMTGNYAITWAALSPATDLVDNDNDGLIDEIDEQDAIYYLRAIAKDKAGNYFTSNIYEMEVDGSAPTMIVNALNGTVLSSTNNIFEIPADGTITVSAMNNTPAFFDNPVTARFQWRYKASQNDSWTSGWQNIDGWKPVVNGTVSVEIPVPTDGYLEGYYGFRAVSEDVLGNTDVSMAETYVVFNDVTGSQVHITRVGSRNIVSDAYGFAQIIEDYEGNILALLDNPNDVNTATFEYALSENGPWTNINTLPINGQTNITTSWTIPSGVRAPFIYLRVIAQDINGNNQSSQTVKLYIDTTSPGIVINSITHTVVNNKKVLDPENSVWINVSFTNLPDVGVVDVSNLDLRLIGPDNSIMYIESYQNVGQASVDFEITTTQLEGLSDGIYRLEALLTDFAGNSTDVETPLVPYGYDALYIDRTAPMNLNVYSTSHPNNQAPYNSSITFRVNYTDLIGIPPTDAVTAEFTYLDNTDTVSIYSVNETDGYIEFVWDPSTAFEQYLIDGLENIVVSADISVKDFLNFEAFVPYTEEFFALTYGIPTNVRMMAVSDVVTGNRVVHFVNWNLANPQVVEQLGTNHTIDQVAALLKLYAYVPHQAEIPENVEFFYRKQGTSTWNTVGTQYTSEDWNFVDPSFNTMFQRQYAIDWDIVDLLGGVYEVKTVSTYLAGDSESIILVDIYNSNLIPMPVVNGMVNGNVERGNTYTIGVASYTGTAAYVDQVRYQYRYVSNAGNVITPLSQWSYFGELDGTQIPEWISTPYDFDWTVYPYYLYNNDIQIVGYAKDKWGTETLISPIIQNNSYVLVHIADTIAPAIQAITVNWDGNENPEWLSGILNPTATVKANIVSNINPNDIVRVEFYYNDTLIHTETGYPVNSQVTNFWTGEYDFAVPTTGNPTDSIKVWTYDIYNNIAKLSKALNIDNTYPVANLTLTQGGIPIANLEREAEITLNANASDLPSGISTVVYYYQMVGDAAWQTLASVENAPYTFDWTIPADLEFGASYAFKTVVTDIVGLATTVISEPLEVIDADTEISIVSVAGHTPVNHVIPFRLHGDFDVVTNVTEGQNIPRLEFLIRSITGNDWRVIEAPYLTELFDYSANFNMNSLPSGNYYLGVAPHGRWVANPVDSVMVTLDNVLNLTGITSIPTSEGYFNGTEFVVNFTVAGDDEINEAAVQLQYSNPIAPETWYGIDVEPDLLTLDGNTYQATFSNIGIDHPQEIRDGYYNYRINVIDNALPEPNVANAIVATNVLYDTGLPNVIFSSISGVTDMELPISIELGSNTIVNAAAFDIMGGQIHLIASGIEKVEFYSKRGLGARIMIATDTTEPYGIIWNTLGYQLGDYTLTAVAYDRAGNFAEYSKQISIVSPVVLQPYAVITAMSFNAGAANEDYIYAVANSWANVQVTGVAFEYYNGTIWQEFAQAAIAVQEDNLWKASFNAELMTNVQKVRTVTTYATDMVSTIKPELVVTYSPLNGGSFITTPAIQSAIYYQDKLNVFEVSNTPYVTTMFNGAFVGMPLVQIVNGDYEAAFNVNAHGLYTFWSSSLDNLGNIQLVKSELQTTNVGTAVSTDNIMSVPVPINSYVYFENVKNPIPLTEGFRPISVQKAALANNTTGGARNVISITMTLNAVVNAQGTVVGMYYYGNEWLVCPAIYNANNNTVTFDAPSGYIYAVAQFADITINASFANTTPQYNDAANNVWTTEDPLIKYFVYDGVNEGGYESPASDEITYSMYIDSLQVAATYANGFISYTASDLPAGAHLTRVVVNKNDFTSIAQKTIYVDVTSPVIVPIPGQITSTNRIVSANISDLETGIHDVTLSINPAGGESYYSALTIPLESMTVIGDIYSYELTLDEIYNLGYHCNSTQSMTVTWNADNNLNMSAEACSILYTVNIEGPAIVFTGFENGWWLNPTHNTPLTFNVIAAQGRTIPIDGVEVAVYEVTPLSSNGDDIQYMTLAPISVVGNVYSYSLNFGQLLSPEATAVLLEVHARDNYNVDNESEQTYGLDYAPPILYAMSPVGDPIDNDGDGLFNEDQIDGINQDQDWDDYDHDGIWDGYGDPDCDGYEPPIIDEDPIDFYPDVLQYGTDVVVSLSYQDIPGYHFLMPYQNWYYTGASGINEATVSVTLNGAPIVGTVTNGTFTYDAGILTSGHYTVVASAGDYVGNVGGLSYTFDIIGGAPTVSFIEPTNGWWLNTNNANTLSFTVQSANQLAEDGVVACIYGEPSNTILQGPMTLAAVDNQYSVVIIGGVIPNGETALRLEVVTTTVWGNSSTSNQTYGVDNIAPQIDIQSPLSNSVFTINSIVNIAAVISDQTTAVKSINPMLNTVKNSQRGSGKPSGSGISNVTLSVIDPSGNNVINEVYPANTQIISEYLTASSYGTYHLNVKAIDGAGNQSLANVTFMVPAPAPEISFMPFDGSGWNYSLVNNEPFHFAINATSNIPVSSVTATFYAMPENVIVQGPHTIAVTPNGIYNVTLGNSITLLTTGVRLEVTATNNLGGTISNSQIYSVDRDLPVITFQYPVNESQITLVNEATKINIRAVYTDMVSGKNGKESRANGSGIASALLVVLNPANEIVLQKTTGADTTEVNASVDNLMVGVYTIRLSVWDKAGNKAVAIITCNVVSAPVPPAPLTITDAHIYPNPVSDGSRAAFVVTLNSSANLSVKVYDFAGREVRELNYYAVVNAKTPVEIAWDGRNAKGDKLARGPYFARVIANDGKKIVEKVVKVAITK